MDRPNNTSRKNRNRFDSLISAGLALPLACFALAFAGTAMADGNSVPVAQQPLTIRPTIPPNIVLMLDDSGSMYWNFMPDWNFLGSKKHSALIDARNNGVYYDPTVKYTPPPKADGTYYPTYTDMADVPTDGIADSGKVDIFTYGGAYDSKAGCASPGTAGCAGSSVPYNTGGIASSYTYKKNYHDTHWHHYLDSWPDKNYNFSTKEGCDNWFDDFYDNRKYHPYYPAEEVYDQKKKTCTIYWYTKPPPYFFQYSTGPVDNPTIHYVAQSDCSGSPDPSHCVLASDQGSDADPENAGAPGGVSVGENVANWFAYYRTRMLMAKSGVMSAFADIDPKYRIGFGSINNNAKDALPSLKYRNLAEVQPFGTGKSGSQKAAFWSWVAAGKAKSSTPLRTALQSVGRYYQTEQAWKSTNETTGRDEVLACRQAYVILTTDGFWNKSAPSVGDADNDKHGPITGPDNQSFTYHPAAPYSGPYSTKGLKDPDNAMTSNTLADVAMYYWNHDLRTDINNEVPTNAKDPAFWQHMVTFTIGIGFTPENIKPDGTSIDDIFKWARSVDQGKNEHKIAGFSWPAPYGKGSSGGSINNIADMAHAAVNGHGGFYSAADPQAFAQGLKEALQRTSERTGAGASVATNSNRLKTGTRIYQGLYHTVKWTGGLRAFKLDTSNGDIVKPPVWNAADQMPAPAKRNIWTYNPDSGAYIELKDSAGSPPALSSHGKAALGADSAAQAAMVKYLRGDDSVNGGKWRQRDGALGDIVDSQPIAVGAVQANEFANKSFPGSSQFESFAQAHEDRSPRLYVAANDGMLHAFDAETGEETYAYLPAAVITHGAAQGSIAELADPDYGITIAHPHQFFNDGRLAEADAYFAEDGQEPVWHSVLVGTTGRGNARAVYALDVTDPDDIQFLWERSAYTDSDKCAKCSYIGQMTGKPRIAQVADGTWAVLIGNGYNSAEDKAALLQFKLADGTLHVHTAGDGTGNGLSKPAVWIDDASTYVSTAAYAGDLLGNVWSFQLSQTADNGDGTPTVEATPDSAGQKLFTATDDNGKAQPITAGMLVGRDPVTGNRWVFFGTGRYLANADISDTDIQSLYGIIVQSPDANRVSNLAQGRAALAQRKVIAQSASKTVTDEHGNTKTIPAKRAVTLKKNATPVKGKSGWVLDLVPPGGGQTGERIVSNAIFHFGRLLVSTMIPDSKDICNPSGTGFVMHIAPFTGTNPVTNVFDANGDGAIGPGDSIELPDVSGTYVAAAGRGVSTGLPSKPNCVGASCYVQDSSGYMGGTPTPPPASSKAARVSWRELIRP
jgi:type IV pilus assembly protein PilY1